MTERYKTIVLMLSKNFPKSTIHAGKPTKFHEKLINQLDYQRNHSLPSPVKPMKKHTIRSNYDMWVHNIEKINAGGYVLSVREWEGKPYRSKQVEIANFNGQGKYTIGYERITMNFNPITKELKCVINGKPFKDIESLAMNDGMTVAEFKDWFFGQGMDRKLFTGIIIHFSDMRYNI